MTAKDLDWADVERDAEIQRDRYLTAEHLLGMMERDGLPVGSAKWTGKTQWTADELNGKHISEDEVWSEEFGDHDVTEWYQFRDESGIHVWVTYVVGMGEDDDTWMSVDHDEFMSTKEG